MFDTFLKAHNYIFGIIKEVRKLKFFLLLILSFFYLEIAKFGMTLVSSFHIAGNNIYPYLI